MDEVEVQVLTPEMRDRLLDGRNDVVLAVAVRPELRRDPKVIALDLAFGEDLGEGRPDLRLVPVDRCTIDVPVADLDGLLDGRTDLSRGRLPGSKAQRGHPVSAGEVEESHGGY